jgi:hypothetical protein
MPSAELSCFDAMLLNLRTELNKSFFLYKVFSLHYFVKATENRPIENPSPKAGKSQCPSGREITFQIKALQDPEMRAWNLHVLFIVL